MSSQRTAGFVSGSACMSACVCGGDDYRKFTPFSISHFVFLLSIRQHHMTATWPHWWLVNHCTCLRGLWTHFSKVYRRGSPQWRCSAQRTFKNFSNAQRSMTPVTTKLMKRDVILTFKTYKICFSPSNFGPSFFWLFLCHFFQLKSRMRWD